MKKLTKLKSASRPLLICGFIFSIVSLMAFGFNVGSSQNPVENKTDFIMKDDSLASVKAFGDVYAVLMSPRCMNCHPSGDIPLQGDNSILHTMSPQRGVDGEGLYAMKCTNCHQPQNSPGLHAPPGNPVWHLPPADMKMVFQGKTPPELARQLIDPKQNGNKDIKKLIEHADDELVLWGWKPGEGRTLPPISHAQFKKSWITWLLTGAYAPKGK